MSLSPRGAGTAPGGRTPCALTLAHGAASPPPRPTSRGTPYGASRASRQPVLGRDPTPQRQEGGLRALPTAQPKLPQLPTAEKPKRAGATSAAQMGSGRAPVALQRGQGASRLCRDSLAFPKSGSQAGSVLGRKEGADGAGCAAGPPRECWTSSLQGQGKGPRARHRVRHSLRRENQGTGEA